MKLRASMVAFFNADGAVAGGFIHTCDRKQTFSPASEAECFRQGEPAAVKPDMHKYPPRLFPG